MRTPEMRINLLIEEMRALHDHIQAFNSDLPPETCDTLHVSALFSFIGDWVDSMINRAIAANKE